MMVDKCNNGHGHAPSFGPLSCEQSQNKMSVSWMSVCQAEGAEQAKKGIKKEKSSLAGLQIAHTQRGPLEPK